LCYKIINFFSNPLLEKVQRDWRCGAKPFSNSLTTFPKGGKEFGSTFPKGGYGFGSTFSKGG